MLSMLNLARIAKVVALLLFILPWVTISCSPRALSQVGGADAAAMAGAPDVPLATATGLQLASGSVTISERANADSGAPGNPFGQPDMAVAGGALLILLSLAVTFVLKGSRGALVAAAGSALAAAALCYAVLVEIPKEAREAFSASGAGAGGGPGMPQINAAELAQMIQVKVEIGFWLTIAALVAAVVLNVVAMKGRTVPVVAAATPPAEPPPGA